MRNETLIELSRYVQFCTSFVLYFEQYSYITACVVTGLSGLYSPVVVVVVV